MKRRLFIRYSSADDDKVEIVKDELAANPVFDAVVIASNREPLKPLAQKVMDGIADAWCIVPILTPKSIGTQWINQEIGYARGVNRQLAPLVDKSVINQLKGFIHREVDLPYTYASHEIAEIENEAFRQEFRKLVADLEARSATEPPDQRKLGQIPQPQTDFERTLAALDERREEEVFNQKKISFFRSTEGEATVKAAFEGLIQIAADRSHEIGLRGIPIASERHPSRPHIAVRAGRYTVTFATNSLERVNERVFQLWVIRWRGYVSFEAGRIPFEQPKRLEEWTYEADLTPEFGLIWADPESKDRKSSETLVEESLSWLVEQALDPHPTEEYDYDSDEDGYGGW